MKTGETRFLNAIFLIEVIKHMTMSGNTTNVPSVFTYPLPVACSSYPFSRNHKPRIFQIPYQSINTNSQNMRRFRVVNVTSDSRNEADIRRADQDEVAGGGATPPSDSNGERTDSLSDL